MSILGLFVDNLLHHVRLTSHDLRSRLVGDGQHTVAQCGLFRVKLHNLTVIQRRVADLLGSHAERQTECVPLRVDDELTASEGDVECLTHRFLKIGGHVARYVERRIIGIGALADGAGLYLTDGDGTGIMPSLAPML